MTDAVAPVLQAAVAAGRRGDWARARDAFASVMDTAGPAAELGLADALTWLGDTAGAIRHARRAYTALRRSGDLLEACDAAILLYFLHRVSLGNAAAARGWLGRFERTVADHDLEPPRGWVLLLRAYERGESGDAEGALPGAEAALAHARVTGDADLEICALSTVGALLVTLGRLGEGVPLQDEAMAGALAGEGERADTLVFACCSLITTCSRAAQFARAAQWIRVARGVADDIASFHVHTTCRLHLGTVLIGTGRWDEAEGELLQVVSTARAAEPLMFAEALARLADLRLAQGRVDEAATLLRDVADVPEIALSRAAVLLAAGDPAAGAAILRRRLRSVGDRCLEAAPLVELLVEIEMAGGRAEPAARHAAALAALADRLGCDVIVARAARALGRIAATGSAEAALRHLEVALEAFCRLEMPFEAARTHLLLAEVLAAGAPADAVAEARAALTAFEVLGAARHAAAARALLRTLGAPPGPVGPRSTALLTRREVEVLDLLGRGLPNRDIAERLHLTRKTVEHHVHNVLGKLGLRNRAEAAAYAVRHLEGDRATT